MKTRRLRRSSSSAQARPGPSFEQKVHALEDELIGIVAQIQDPLHAHDLFAELGE